MPMRNWPMSISTSVFSSITRPRGHLPQQTTFCIIKASCIHFFRSRTLVALLSNRCATGRSATGGIPGPSTTPSQPRRTAAAPPDGSPSWRAGHQRPQETRGENATRRLDQGPDTPPYRAASALDPGWLAGLEHHHEPPGQHSHMHEGPEGPQGRCLLREPGQALHGHGRQGADGGIAEQAAGMVGGETARMPTPGHPSHPVLRRGRRCLGRTCDHAAGRGAHGKAVGPAREPHEQRGRGQGCKHGSGSVHTIAGASSL